MRSGCCWVDGRWQVEKVGCAVCWLVMLAAMYSYLMQVVAVNEFLQMYKVQVDDGFPMVMLL